MNERDVQEFIALSCYKLHVMRPFLNFIKLFYVSFFDTKYFLEFKKFIFKIFKFF